MNVRGAKYHHPVIKFIINWAAVEHNNCRRQFNCPDDQGGGSGFILHHIYDFPIPHYLNQDSKFPLPDNYWVVIRYFTLLYSKSVFGVSMLLLYTGIRIK